MLTIASIRHNPVAFSNYLEPSLNNSNNHNYQFLSLSDTIPPATSYNQTIDNASNDIIMFIHEDVSFCPNFIDFLLHTIYQYPNFGILGVEGAINDNNFKLIKYEWANANESKILTTVDACVAVINRKHGLKFDDINFNNYHCYVEDYSTQIRRKHGLECRTIFVNAYPSYWLNIDKENYVIHKAVTCQERGHCWGDFIKYMGILQRKWNFL